MSFYNSMPLWNVRIKWPSASKLPLKYSPFIDIYVIKKKENFKVYFKKKRCGISDEYLMH